VAGRRDKHRREDELDWAGLRPAGSFSQPSKDLILSLPNKEKIWVLESLVISLYF